MLKPSIICAVVCQLLTSSFAAELRIQIPASTLLPNPNTLPSTTHATLVSGAGAPLDAILRKDNTIVFPDVPTTGSHLLTIHTRDYVFAPYRVDISSGSSTTQISAVFEIYPGTPWSDHGIALIPAESTVTSYTLHPKLLRRKVFYEERPTFSPLSLLKNPMILMGGLALVFTIGLPKLMENMDPEMRAEFEEMQKQGPTASIGRAISGQGPASSAGDFDLAGYLAGSGTSGSGGKTSGREGTGNIRERRR